MKRIICTVTVVCALCLMSGCGKPPAEKRPSLKIAISQWPGYALVSLAQEKGFFAKNGVEVELIFRKELPESMTLYENGETDGLACVFADILFMNAAGIPTKAVYVIDYSVEGDVIIARPAITSLAELKGKIIGIDAVNGFSHIFALNALEKKGGLAEADILFKQVPAHGCLAAIERGEIDAGHTWEPTKSAAIRKGYQVLCKAGEFPYLIVDVLVFNAGTIKKRPDDIRRAVAAMAEAQQYLTAHRDEAIDIMARALKMDKAEMTSGVDGACFPDIGENVAMFRKDGKEKSLPNAVKVITGFYQVRGQLTSGIDCDQLMDSRFIDKVTSGRGGDQ